MLKNVFIPKQVSHSLIHTMKTYLRLLLVLVITGSLIPLWGCQYQVDVCVPEEFIGVWLTEAPKYKDRSLDFTKYTVSFRMGENGYATHLINKIESVKGQNDEMDYTFYYTDVEGEQWTLVLTYFTDTGTIKLKNTNMIWENCDDKEFYYENF